MTDYIARPTSVMWFHPLQSMAKESSSSEVYLTSLCDYTSFHLTSRPEGMPHAAPRLRRISAEEGLPILAGLKTRGGPGHGQVDNALFVDDRFDSKRVTGIIQGEGAAVGMEGEFVGVEIGLVERIRRPQGCSAVGIEDLGVELTGCVEAAEHDRLRSSL